MVRSSFSQSHRFTMLPPSLLARLNQRKKSCVNSFACNHKACQVNQIVSDRGAVARRIACYASAAATKSWSDLVGLGRFELPTSPLSGVRSNQLSYRPVSTCLQMPWPRCFTRSVDHVLICTLTPSLPKRLARPFASCVETPR